MKLLKVIALVGLPIVTLFLCMTNESRHGRFYFTALMLYIIFERVWEGLYTSRDKDSDKVEGDWTLPVSVVSYILLIELCMIEFYAVNRRFNPVVSIIAAIAYLFALFMRLWAVRTLGDQWSIHIVGKDKLTGVRKLVETGPYRYVVHPVYLGIILEQVSIPLISNLYFTGMVAVFFSIFVQFRKAGIEESEMKKHLGDAYACYIRKRPRFNLLRGLIMARRVR